MAVSQEMVERVNQVAQRLVQKAGKARYLPVDNGKIRVRRTQVGGEDRITITLLSRRGRIDSYSVPVASLRNGGQEDQQKAWNRLTKYVQKFEPLAFPPPRKQVIHGGNMAGRNNGGRVGGGFGDQ